MTNIVEAKAKFSCDKYDLIISDYYLTHQETADGGMDFVCGFNDVDTLCWLFQVRLLSQKERLF